ALIEQDIQLPFTVTTFTGGAATSSVQMQSAKLSLKVKPQITADKAIIMDLEIHRDQPKDNPYGGQPILDKKTVKTKLLVDNGETVVLGGIFTRTTSQTEGGVPLLRRIPLLGWLFKKRLEKDQRGELLVFLTPTIIEKSATRGGVE
ncbi:MAG: type IV pilus secretin PilQ, partial [Calditrichaeota bacterium]